MMKGKRGVALAMSLIAISLTACGEDYTYPDASWKDGIIATIGNKTYKYDDIYPALEGTKSSAQAYFNVAKSVLAQAVTTRSDGILSVVDNKIESLHDTWKTNARTNNTSYKEEQEKTFSSEGVEDEDELREKYIAQQRVEENSSSFSTVKTYSADNDGGEYYLSKELTEKFVTEKAPYHVSHILIKVDASSSGDGYYNGQISSDDAKQIANVTRMLSSGTSFGSVAQLASDDSSNTQYGELYTSGSMIAMLKDTSYVNEFKLGVYAYDAFLNSNTSSNTSSSSNAKNSEIRSSLRVPGTSEGSNSESEVAKSIDETLIGKGEAFGIPLSVCFEMNQVAEWEKNPYNGSSVSTENKKSITARQYTRNVLFNNYFNYRGVSFIYKDSIEDFNTRFLAEVNGIQKARRDGGESAATDFADIDTFLKSKDSYLSFKQDEYDYIKGLLDETKDSAFCDYSGKLVNYKSNDKNKAELTEIAGDSHKILASNSNPIIIARAGTSGDSGYQGIHFITLNNDPFTADKNGDYTKKYQYYRANVPSDTKAENSTAYSADYSEHPSFINFVTADANSTTTYNNRRSSLEEVVKASLPSEDIALWEYNLQTFKEKFNKDFTDYLPENVKKLVNQYITLNKESSSDSADETLDSSWETYVNELITQESLTQERMVSDVCIGSFEGGYFTKDMEEACYVE